MTIGTGTFLPDGQFNIQRSYLTGFAIDHVFDTVLSPPPHFESAPAGAGGDHYFLEILPAFWAWNTNSYTLDHIVIAAYKTTPPSPVQTAFNFVVRYMPPTPLTPAAVEVLAPGFVSFPVYFPFPQRNVPYWLPDL